MLDLMDWIFENSLFLIFFSDKCWMRLTGNYDCAPFLELTNRGALSKV